MQKAFNIIAGLLIVAFGILLFMMWRSIRKLEVKVEAIALAMQTAAAANPQRTSINGGDFWKEIKDSAENLSIEVKLKP